MKKGLLLALLSVLACAAMVACDDSSDEQSAVAEQMRKNVEEFEYEAGKQGGALTFATISIRSPSTSPLPPMRRRRAPWAISSRV